MRNLNTSQIKELKEYLISLAAYVRVLLRAYYNVERGEHEDYRGLCDFASELFCEEFERQCDKHVKKYGRASSYDNFTTEVRHGEIAHSNRFPSEYWCLEHTYVTFHAYDQTFYIDLTCQQFQWLNPGIPAFYVGTKPPWWIYDDQDNPRWERKGWYGFWNRIILMYGKKRHRLSVVEFCQYKLWGLICDVQRFFKGKKTPECPF